MIALAGRVYRGRKGFERWRAEVREHFEYDLFEPQAVRIGTENRTVVLGRLHCRAPGSPAELDLPLAHVYWFRDEKLVRLTMHLHPRPALEEAGIQD
jgi:hypothetical protein